MREYRRTYTRRTRTAHRRHWPLIVFPAVFAVVVVVALALSRRNPDTFITSDVKTPPEGPPFVIALDAGHGGNDVGATGLLNEVEMTERTIAYLYDMLQEDPNYAPLLCRENGQNATNTERAGKAAKAKAALLLSVHGNADESPDSHGFECFPAPPGRKWHEEARQLASLLAEEMGAAGSRLRGESGVRYAYYPLTSNSKIFREASDTTVYNDASFGIVEKPDCPAVLVEQCFITNQADYEAFATEEGCKRAAQCYYRAICRYFGTTVNNQNAV